MQAFLSVQPKQGSGARKISAPWWALHYSTSAHKQKCEPEKNTIIMLCLIIFLSLLTPKKTLDSGQGSVEREFK